MQSTKLVTAIALACIAISASAQCTKDTDCKGDRICSDQGRCTSPTAPVLKPPIASAPSAALPPHMTVVERLEKRLEDVLKCDQDPVPMPLLNAMRTMQLTQSEPAVVEDGMQVFWLQKPVYVYGMKVIQVTGYDPKQTKVRLPGTETPLNFTVVVNTSEIGALGAMVKYGITKPVVSKATYTKYTGDAASITCYGK